MLHTTQFDTKNDLENIKIKIPPSSLLDFSPKFGFITSPEYFDFTFLKVKIITHSQFVFGNKNKNSEFIELSKDIKLFN